MVETVCSCHSHGRLTASRLHYRYTVLALELLSVCNVCIVAKRCVLEQVIIDSSTRIGNRLVPKWMALTFWPLIRQRVEFKLSVLEFNCPHNLAPSYSCTCASRSLITLVVVTYARLRVVTLLFQPQGRSGTVFAALPWQDHPLGTLFQHHYAAVILYRRDLNTELFRAYHQ